MSKEQIDLLRRVEVAMENACRLGFKYQSIAAAMELQAALRLIPQIRELDLVKADQ